MFQMFRLCKRFGWTPEQYQAADARTCDWFAKFDAEGL